MKKIMIIVVAVCLVAGLALLGAGRLAKEEPLELRLSHKSVTLGADHALGRVWVTYTGDADLHWSSSNEEIVKVDQHGMFRGVAPGVACVTCTDGVRNAQCMITVVREPPDYAFSGPQAIKLRAGEKQRVQYTYTGPGTLGWEVSDSKVAAFKDGVLVAKKPGTTVLSCTDGVKVTQALVTVRGWWE